MLTNWLTARLTASVYTWRLAESASSLRASTLRSTLYISGQSAMLKEVSLSHGISTNFFWLPNWYR